MIRFQFHSLITQYSLNTTFIPQLSPPFHTPLPSWKTTRNSNIRVSMPISSVDLPSLFSPHFPYSLPPPPYFFFVAFFFVRGLEFFVKTMRAFAAFFSRATVLYTLPEFALKYFAFLLKMSFWGGLGCSSEYLHIEIAFLRSRIVIGKLQTWVKQEIGVNARRKAQIPS